MSGSKLWLAKYLSHHVRSSKHLRGKSYPKYVFESHILPATHHDNMIRGDKRTG